MKPRYYAILLLLFFLMISCRLGARQAEPTPLPAEVVVSPTAAVDPTPTSTAVAENQSEPPEANENDDQAEQPEPEQSVVSSNLPDPMLFEIAWTDRSPFTQGLIPDQQSVLTQLPGATVYHLDFEIQDNLTTLTGQEEVLYTNRENEPLSTIFFHLYPNLLGGRINISEVKLNGLPVEPTFQADDAIMGIPLAQVLQPEEKVVIAMAFTINVPTTLERNYGIFALDKDILALAHFYPMVAVYDQNGWDVEIPAPQGDVVYADTNFYLVRVTMPEALKLVTSGVTLSQESQDVRQTTTIAAGPMRDFYLAASPRYDMVTATLGDTTVNSYALADQLDSAQQVLEIALNALESFNNRYGIYPFTEFDLVPTSNLALGIEYPGIVVITLPLYDPDAKVGDVPSSAFLESTVAHEVGHQWFYSLVGNDQLAAPWLDESLTQYATWRYYLDTGGQEAADRFEEGLRSRWSAVKDEEIPIGLPVGDYKEVAYSAIVYGRGPLFVDALAERMGQSKLDTFLKDYALAYRWQLVTEADFKTMAESECSCDLSDLFATWVDPK